MHFKNSLSLFLLFFYLYIPLVAQTSSDRELNKNRSRLDEIKSEIDNLKKQLTSSQKNALSVSNQISLIDKEMSLIAQTRGLLLREQNILERRSKNNRENLSDTKDKLSNLKKLYSERLVYLYKYGKIKNLTLLLTAQSFNQTYIRYRYLKLIAEYDEKTILSIAEKQKEIEQLQKQLAEDLDSKNRSIREKQNEEQKYKISKQKKNGLLAKLKKDQTFYNQQIVLKNDEQKKLVSMIATLERQRIQQSSKPSNDEFVMIDFDNFTKGKGKLPWPVKGRVISTFGRQYDPVSKTSVNNSGIEIQSKVGTPVKCVFTGVVRMITYLGGYGNTVIIDHGHGYYTVYSHLDEVYVRKNDIVETNQIIAQVGDSGSLAGSKLHFEIYGGNQPYNPQTWLR